MFHCLKVMFVWLVCAMPDISNAILIFVGIIMSFPKFAENIENDKTRRRQFVIPCLLIGALGLLASEYQRTHAETQMTVLLNNTNKLVVKTDKEVTNTDGLVVSVGVFIPQMNTFGIQLVSIRRELDAAKGDAKQT